MMIKTQNNNIEKNAEKSMNDKEYYYDFMNNRKYHYLAVSEQNASEKKFYQSMMKIEFRLNYFCYFETEEVLKKLYIFVKIMIYYVITMPKKFIKISTLK